MSQLAKTETAIKTIAALAEKGWKGGKEGEDIAEGINKTQEADPSADRDGDERRVWD